MSSITQLAGYALVLYLGWRLLRATILKPASPLDNIPGPPSDGWMRGNIRKMFDPRASWDFQRKVVDQYGRVATLNSLFGTKILYTIDPRALHNIYVKEQDVYEESELLLTNFGLYLGPGLLATLGDQHRRQRKMLNPLFSAKHLREMTPIFTTIIQKLEYAISSRVGNGTQELDILNWMGRTALELIGQGGLGHSFDPLTEDVADEFADSVKAYFPVQTQLNMVVRQFMPYLVRIGPAALRRKIVEMAPKNGPSHHMMCISDALSERSHRIVNEKKRALQQGDEALKQQVGEGKDIMSVLLRENMKASAEDRLSDEEVVAQVSTLVLAAMDTTSNALARIFHLLAIHPEIQQKLRDEIIQARDDGTGKLRDLEYDEIMELPYLDAVCRETLRRYPPVGGLMRVVRKDSVMPLSAPIRGRDGTMIESIPVKKGMRIITDIRGSNTNVELWGPDAYEWKPERWMNPLPRTLEEAHIPGVYSHLMTFIGGARACIGFKFSQLEMKVVLATLIPAFKYELSDKPIEWNAAGVAYPSVGESRKPEMPLRVTRLKV
ncbi:Docosahexaenoic acid omega-hydroxylase CYP4F3 [Trametes pubescens]|uniref:Docosahexaenoic acid omega-hydroxylase CYP4F3 n=1 Tax=Trametes pubescens TaxID=154538 RepID=A0A1M2V352_TRAPU|nr:Docosahexaenoic acid omega-hydroxylase CYP4F3 [Trametes pubescens]